MYPQKSDPKKTVRACIKNAKVSTKDSIEIGRFIKGKNLDKVENYLKDVLELKKAIPYRRFTSGVGHKKGYGPAKYPINATKEIIKLIKNVRNNAEDRGFDTKKLFIKYFYATHGNRYLRPRRSRFRGERGKSTNISIIVEERG